MSNGNMSCRKNPFQDSAFVIQRLSRLIEKKVNRTGLFSAIAEEFRAVFQYDRLSIYLYEADREFLHTFAMPDGTGVEIFSNSRIAQSTIAWQAIQGRKPIVINDLSSVNLDGATSLFSAGLNVTICVPLFIDDKAIGTIHVSFINKPENIFDILNFLTSLVPVLTMLLFIVLIQEKEFRDTALQKSSIKSADGQSAFDKVQLEESLLLTDDMKSVMSLAAKVAKLKVPVLITGETGTGKSMLARWIHFHSARKNGPFVKVNCPSLPPTLFESELFGYAKGAFTGAYSKRIGRIELASKGSLFLDEIGELSPDMQSKLLQVLEDNSYERVGDSTSIAADIRILSATNICLRDALASGQLRRDLFYRLAPVILRLPPLRERRNDIPILVEYFLQELSNCWKIRPPKLSSRILECLCAHSWPGNIREVRNVVSRILLLSLDHSLSEQAVRDALLEWQTYEDGMLANRREKTLANSSPLPEVPEGKTLASLQENERAHILEALQKTHGRISGPRGAAHLLGIPRSTLQHKMQKLGISNEDYYS